MTIHVYPLHDWIDHQIESEAVDCQCPCEPTIHYMDGETGEALDEPLVVHNAIDQREKDEPDYEG